MIYLARYPFPSFIFEVACANTKARRTMLLSATSWTIKRAPDALKRLAYGPCSLQLKHYLSAWLGILPETWYRLDVYYSAWRPEFDSVMTAQQSWHCSSNIASDMAFLEVMRKILGQESFLLLNSLVYKRYATFRHNFNFL